MVCALLQKFQFHKGTIRTPESSGGIRSSFFHFNSIKVRLEHKYRAVEDGNAFTFQFHKGTIRTGNWQRFTFGYEEFQFHKGTIRTSNFTPKFNTLNKFQFHKGTIRTR